MAVPSELPELGLILSLDKPLTLATASFFLAGVPIGQAYISIDGSVAELEDFVLFVRGPHPWRLMNLLMIHRCYRGRGYGSVLMPKLITALRNQGIRRLRGTIQSPRGTLPGWYRRMGFQVDDRTGRIGMELLALDD